MARVGTTQGVRGFFAVLYDQDGPIQSGIGSYATQEEAKQEARDWARSEGLPCDFDEPKKDHRRCSS